MKKSSTPIPDKYTPSVDRMASRFFLVLTGLFLIFIMVASWYTSQGDSLPPQIFNPRALFEFKSMLAVHDLRDITTNVLLYMPLGIFLSLAVSWRRPRFFSLWLLIGFLTSFIMESGQFFIGRSPDPVDIVTNTSGFILGFWIVVIAVKFFGLRPSILIGISQNEEIGSKARSVAAFRFIYLCIFFIVTLAPYDISVSLFQIYNKFVQPDENGKLKVILDVLYHLRNWPQDGTELFLSFLAFLPIAILTAFLDGLRKSLNVFSLVLVCLAVAVLSETMQLFVLSRTSDIVALPLAVLAGFTGWVLVKLWFGLQNNVDPTDGLKPVSNKKRIIILALAGYALLICLLAWAPYEFETDPRAIAHKVLHESNLIPFKEHFAVRDLGSALDIVKESGIFIPFGILNFFWLNISFPRLSRLKKIILTGLICFTFAVLVEISQAAFLERFIDVTDIILAAAGGMMGSLMFRVFSKKEGS